MATKKTTPLGPKAQLMKKSVDQLKRKAKQLKIQGYSTKKKEQLVNSIMMAEARAKRKPGTRKKKAATGTVKKVTATVTMAQKKKMPRRKTMVKPKVKMRRPMMSEYNGWKNYETWYINLNFGDYFQEIYDEHSLEGDYDFIYYSDYYKDAVEDMVLGDEAANYMSYVQSGMISAFLSEVDYDQIARHYIE